MTTSEVMKVHLLYQTTTLPSGGGNQFLRTLDNFFSIANVRAESLEKSDIVLFNSHHFLDKVAGAKRQFPKKVFVHRIDGPMRLYNRKSDSRDQAVNMAAKLISDGTIFQSKWSRDANYRLSLHKNDFERVIFNAPDPSIFNRKRGTPFYKDGKIKVIATSWSDNPRKGFDVYKWIDENLNFSLYDTVFVGNSPITFKNIRHITPIVSRDLAEEIKNSDIFITASQRDPCSNSLIEALHCGLPALVYNDGGHPEILGKAGELFQKPEEIPDLLDKIAANYTRYQAKISLPSIENVAGQYLDFMREIYEKAREGRYKPKRLTRAGLIRIQTQLNAWRFRGKLTAVRDLIRARIYS